jgi:hypothetical protein
MSLSYGSTSFAFIIDLKIGRNIGIEKNARRGLK